MKEVGVRSEGPYQMVDEAEDAGTERENEGLIPRYLYIPKTGTEWVRLSHTESGGAAHDAFLAGEGP